MGSAENRRHQRIDLTSEKHQLILQVQTDTGSIIERSVRPHDLSRDGMAFTDQRPIKAGTRCIMLVSHQGSSLRIIGKVTHSRPNADGSHLMGMRFITITMIPATTPGLVLTDNPAVGQLLIHI
jgi:hypothetical protein